MSREEINSEITLAMTHFDPTSPTNGTFLTVTLAVASLGSNMADFDSAITPVVHLIQGGAALVALVIGLLTIQRMIFKKGK